MKIRRSVAAATALLLIPLGASGAIAKPKWCQGTRPGHAGEHGDGATKGKAGKDHGKACESHGKGDESKGDKSKGEDEQGGGAGVGGTAGVGDTD